jgi:ABC-2 type transport system ATP-binding protein
LDEPTSGVDPITRANFWKIIKDMAQSGITVFVTTHYMDEAENCGRMTLIYKGNIIAMGTPEEMKTRFMKDDIIAIHAPHPEELVGKLAGLKAVKEAAIFGAHIHAVVEDSRAAGPAVEKFLKNEGLKGCRVEKIKPSLEDVFVSLIEDYDREHEPKAN